MHRIDVPSATADNKFTDGSPSGGIPATTVPAAWLNDLQENIMAVLDEGGVVPDRGRATDLANAIVAIANAAVAGSIPGYTPVEQGGVASMQNNKVNLGWSPAERFRLAVSGIDVGPIVLDSNLSTALTAFLPKRAFASRDFLRIPDVPGGLIIQWVLDAPEATSAGDMISFPVPFTTARLGVLATLNALSTSGVGQTTNIVVNSPGLTNFQFVSGGTYGGGGVAYVLAWGY